jgi:hypothetical protein
VPVDARRDPAVAWATACAAAYAVTHHLGTWLAPLGYGSWRPGRLHALAAASGLVALVALPVCAALS